MYFFKRFSERLLKRRLLNVNPDDIPKFSYDGITTYAKIYNVYDGDTVKIIFEYRGEMIKYSARIYGINTPEIRTRDDEEKIKGYAARDFLKSYILNKVLKVDLLEFDKYGRLLIKIYVDINGTIIDISNLMITNNHAKPYFGGTKN